MSSESGKLIGAWYVRARTRWEKQHADVDPVDKGGRLLSGNVVAGPSWDVPIPATCKPTAVCGSTCYALNPAKSITWPASINKQAVRLQMQESDSLGTAAKIADEVKRRSLSHVVVNGAGDLTDQGARLVNHLATLVDVPLWVRTRKPKQAALVDEHPRIFLHFSLDKSSMNRREQVLALRPRANMFFTYQGSPGERIESSHGCALVFADRYNGDLLGEELRPDVVCPLNTLCKPGNPPASAVGACSACRKCFDGTLVEIQRKMLAAP